MKATTEALSAVGTEYLRAWNSLYDEEAAGRADVCRGGNMFIASGRTFREYSEWLFDVLARVRKACGDKPDTDANMRRYCAFMGERLLSVYIQANALPCKGVPVRYKRWWLPLVRTMVRWMHINKDSHLYIQFRNHFGYSSQYHRTE